jgi:hypothetical protein
MQQDSRARLKQWLESGEARLAPLSFPQREIWETSPVPVECHGNHICCFIEIKGGLTEKDTQTSIQRVVDRQEAMRTTILPGKDRPLQLIRNKGTANLTYRELTDAEKKPEALEDVLKETYAQNFDLVLGPLYRVDMLRRGPKDHVLAFSIHHAIADGWSLGVFVEELCAAYLEGLSKMKKMVAAGVLGVSTKARPQPASCTDWAASERVNWTPAALAPHIEYWKQKLDGARQLWPADTAVQRAAEPLQRWASAVPAKLTESVRDLARRSGATLFSTLLSVFQLTLAKWTGQQDIVVGTPVANRNKPAFRDTMGYFAGIVPLRGQVEQDRTFADHLKATLDMTIDAFGHAIPFAELSAALGEPRSPGVHSIFDVRFALQNHLSPDVDLTGISTKLRMRSTGTARFDLACELTEIGSEIEVVWLFKPHIFTPSSIAELNTLFLSVLTRSCGNPASRISALAV